MSYSAAHLQELGLILWRLRSDVDEQPATVAAEAPVSPAARLPAQAQVSSPVADARREPPRRSTQAPAAERSAQATADAQQLQQDDSDRAEVLAARAARIASMDWDQLHGFVQAQTREGASQAVFGVGARDAQAMIIGEAPGAEEDRQGVPFVGRAGQLLDQMLAAIGLSRERNCYIANICKFRPPDNRDPRPQEVAEDMPYLLRQIALVQPRLLIAVGRVAAQNLLDSSDPIGRMRGRNFEFGNQRIATLVTYHPAYLLRSPREKAKAWQDLKRARALLLNDD